MTALHFKLTFTNHQLSNLDLPVEIRKPNMVLVKRARTSEKVEVEPGTYYVGIKMPAGQESWSEVKIQEGSDKEILLGPEPEDKVTSESHELQYYFMAAYAPPWEKEWTHWLSLLLAGVGGIVGALLGYGLAGRELWMLLGAAAGATLLPALSLWVVRPGYSTYKRRTREVRLRKIQGNVLTHDYRLDDDWAPNVGMVKERHDLIEINFKGENGGQIVQLLQTGEPAVNVLLPAWSQHGCQVVLKKQSDARYSLEVHLHNTEAELLIRYWEQGRWQLAANVAKSTAISAERLLYEKRQHPISAAVGAYALLRLGDLERLSDWSANLMNGFEWLPDGAAVRGEHLARIGKHQEALAAFCTLRERGLPYFSDGLSYAIDRLRCYRSVGKKHFDEKALEDCADTLARLEAFGNFADFGKPIMTFTGLDPGKPDAKPVSDKLASHGGVEVTELARLQRPEKEIAMVVADS